ncbi:MAG: GspH/FimT family pseudopilin [Methylococcales bacterium]
MAKGKGAVAFPASALQQANKISPRPLLEQGFTLLELLVVLFIMVLGFSAISINLSSGTDTLEIKSAAIDMVSALRYARGQALVSHKESTVSIDLTENTYSVSGRGKTYHIPEAIDVSVVTAQDELEEGVANLRFFPDGSSIGGRVTLEKDNVGWQIDINWLTGASELSAK